MAVVPIGKTTDEIKIKEREKRKYQNRVSTRLVSLKLLCKLRRGLRKIRNKGDEDAGGIEREKKSSKRRDSDRLRDQGEGASAVACCSSP